MANEISFNLAFQVNKLGAGVSGQANLSQTMSGNNFQSTVQDVGASTEALVISAEIGVGGWQFIKNMTDSVGGTILTPTLTISTANPATSTTTIAVLLPGEGALFKSGTNTLYGISSTGNCPAQVLVAEP